VKQSYYCIVTKMQCARAGRAVSLGGTADYASSVAAVSFSRRSLGEGRMTAGGYWAETTADYPDFTDGRIVFPCRIRDIRAIRG
jgi:hypothetical protein